MSTEKKGGKKKTWYEQFYPIWIENPPIGAVRHSKLPVWVVKKQNPKKGECWAIKPEER